MDLNFDLSLSWVVSISCVRRSCFSHHAREDSPDRVAREGASVHSGLLKIRRASHRRGGQDDQGSAAQYRLMHPARCISLVLAEHRCFACLVSLTLSAFIAHSLLIVSPSRSRSLLGHGSLHQVLGGAQPSP